MLAEVVLFFRSALNEEQKASRAFERCPSSGSSKWPLVLPVCLSSCYQLVENTDSQHIVIVVPSIVDSYIPVFILTDTKHQALACRYR